jgi:hypothetical protein
MEEAVMINTVLAGTTEIAEHFGVRTNVVGNWISRYPDFPAPVAELAMGRAWDLNEVVDWFNHRWASE